jgi:hypothetical protein
MAAFWAVLTFGGSGPALTAHGSLDLKQEIQIQIQGQRSGIELTSFSAPVFHFYWSPAVFEVNSRGAAVAARKSSQKSKKVKTTLFILKEHFLWKTEIFLNCIFSAETCCPSFL